MSIDVGLQKSNIRGGTVSKDNNDKLELNPGVLMAQTIQHLQSYLCYSNKWKLYTYYDRKKFSRVASAKILVVRKAAVNTVGFDMLGFTSMTLAHTQ